MFRRAAATFALVAWLQLPAVPEASDLTLETPNLVVSDATGKLSNEQLEGLANQARTTSESILAFWSADPGIDRFGKIRVLFDVPRRDVYSSVFYWDKKDGQRIRVVRVFGTDGSPQMMAHKLTSAILPNQDKLIRNMMGIVTEAQVGNPSTFPMCGFAADDWVLALLKTPSYIPLSALGPDHESWGMKDHGGGRLSIHDQAKQHRAYAEAGSFGAYLFTTYGISKIKRFHRLSHEKDRPWQDVFGIGLEELEAHWINALSTSQRAGGGNVPIVSKLLATNAGTACAEAQKLSGKK